MVVLSGFQASPAANKYNIERSGF